MSQQLTRKDIKRDELANAMEKGVEYAESHARTLLIAVGTLVAVAVIAALWFTYRGHRSENANEALAQAIKVYQAPIDPTAARPDDPDSPTFADEAARMAKAKTLFQTVFDDYGSTSAGSVGAVYLGQIAMAENQPDRARELWKGFVDKHGDHLLAGEVRVNLFRLDRSSGKAEEVAKDLTAMLDQAEPPLPQDVVLGELAETQVELGKTQEAVQSYQRIVDEFPQSPYAQDARQKITELDPSRAAAPGLSGMPGMSGF